jgi:hypothetical protein
MLKHDEENSSIQPDLSLCAMVELCKPKFWKSSLQLWVETFNEVENEDRKH